MANAFSNYLEDNKSLTSKARIFIISNVGKKRKWIMQRYSRTSLLRFFELLIFFFSQSICNAYLGKSPQEMGEKSNAPTQQRKYKPRETSSKPPDEKQQKKKIIKLPLQAHTRKQDSIHHTQATITHFTQGSPNIAQTPPDPTPQAVGDRGLSWSTKVFQLTPRFHQTHLLWELSSRKTGTAASFRERLRA
jgi:hypothetical protein